MNVKSIRSLAGLALAVACLLPGGNARAQGLRIMPSVGLYAPLADFGTVEGVSGAVDFGKKESTLAYGLGLGFGSGILGFRVGGSYATSSDVPVRGVGCQTCEARATALVATGDLVLRPIPKLILLQPYLLAGVGGKWYNFDSDRLQDEELDALVDDQARLTGHLGAGITINPGGLGIFGEISDYMSGFDFDKPGDSNLQHDLFLNVGIVLQLGR